MENPFKKTAKENILRLPAECYGVLESENKLIRIKAGEMGYYEPDPLRTHLVNINSMSPDEQADALNTDLGINKQTRKAMQWGSMFGWGGKLAQPEAYNEDGTISEVFRKFEIEYRKV